MLTNYFKSSRRLQQDNICNNSKAEKQYHDEGMTFYAKRDIVSMDNAFANRDEFLVLNVFYTKENAKELEIQTNPHLQAQIFE